MGGEEFTNIMRWGGEGAKKGGRAACSLGGTIQHHLLVQDTGGITIVEDD